MAFAAKLLLGVILLVLGIILCGMAFLGAAWLSDPNAPKGAALKLLAWGVALAGLGIAFLVF